MVGSAEPAPPTVDADAGCRIPDAGRRTPRPLTRLIPVFLCVQHCVEQDYPIPEEPVLFSKFASAIVGPGEPVVLEETKELDFEVELVIVIGKECRHLKKADAAAHVLGYTVAHDVSARDWQLKRNGGQWLLGKTFDSFAPLGPSIVTTDELGDPHDLRVSCTVNGQVVQDSRTTELVFKTGELLEYITRYTLLSSRRGA